MSVDGVLSALSQDATYNLENVTNLRWWPWWTIPLGVTLFAVAARKRDPVWSVRWGVPVGLALSPVLWPAYLPALGVMASTVVVEDRVEGARVLRVGPDRTEREPVDR